MIPRPMPRAVRRRSAAFVVALLAMFGLSSCAQGWGLSSSGSKESNGVVHLTYALWDPYEQVGYQASIDRFERLHPNIKVTIEQIPYANYAQKITAEFVSHNAPDLFWANTPFLASWIGDGMVSNLTAKIEADHIDLSQYYPQLVKLHEKNGKIYGLPKDWDTIALYYNKTYFAKHHIRIPPTLTWNPQGTGTFDRLLRDATVDKHGRHPGEKGFDAGAVTTYGSALGNDLQSVYSNYVSMNGGSVLRAPYTTDLTLDQPKAKQALSYLVGLSQRQHVTAPASQLGPDAAGTTTVQLFASGQIAILQAGDWNTTSVTQSVKFKVGVLPLPTGPTGRISVFNGLVDTINSHTSHPQQAWELEKWLGSADSQRILGSGGYVWPAIKSLDPLFVQSWQKKAGIDMTPFLTEARGKTVNFPVAPGFAVALDDMTSALGPAFLGSESVPAAAADAVARGEHDLKTAY